VVTGYLVNVARCVQNSLRFVRATIWVALIEGILQISYSAPELPGVGVQMVLVPTAVFSTVIEFAIQISLEIPAQAIQSPNGIAQITVVIATITAALAVVAGIAISVTTIIIVPVTIATVIGVTITSLSRRNDRQTQG
jgi:hypothetical protein